MIALCGGKTRPKMTPEQIALCEKCSWISKKKLWCGFPTFGFFIHDPDKVVGKLRIGGTVGEGKVRVKKAVRQRPKKKKKKYPSIITQASSFGNALGKQVKAGNPKRSDEETARIMLICEGCEFYNQQRMRCYKCGCRMKHKIPWQTTHCNIGKW